MGTDHRNRAKIQTHSWLRQSGNTGEDQNGEPVIYDPSSMFAHNEFE